MYIDASTILSRCTAEVWLALPYASCKDSRNVTCRIDRVSAACCALVAAGSRIGTMDCFLLAHTVVPIGYRGIIALADQGPQAFLFPFRRPSTKLRYHIRNKPSTFGETVRQEHQTA